MRCQPTRRDAAGPRRLRRGGARRARLCDSRRCAAARRRRPAPPRHPVGSRRDRRPQCRTGRRRTARTRGSPPVNYPTRRAIYLLLLGAPMALALGLVRPELWLVAPGWISVILACLIVDTITGANPRRAEIALALDERLADGGRLAADMHKSADANALTRTLSLTASRRGQALVEALWIRWAGPLGLVWKQRKFAISGAINVVPSLRAVTDEGSRQ